MNSLRQLLERLEQNGQLVRMHDALHPEPDLRYYLQAAASFEEKSPAVIFDNIKGYAGMQLAANLHGSWVNHALMLGMEKNAGLSEQFDRINTLCDIPPVTDALPLVELPHAEKQGRINLYEMMPLFRTSKYDGGFYLGKACIITRRPGADTDKVSLSVCPVAVQGPDLVCISASGALARHIAAAGQADEPLHIAICVGNPPLMAPMVAANASDITLSSVAAAMNSPFRVGRTQSGLYVPESSEYILECRLTGFGYEGPRKDQLGRYTSISKEAQFRVNRLVCRENPIFESLYVGERWFEHAGMIGMWYSVRLFRQIAEEFPVVRCINAMNQCGATVIVSVADAEPALVRAIAMRIASLPSSLNTLKTVILVDGDVDPYNARQVMWSLAANMRPGRDVLVLGAGEEDATGGQLFVDATGAGVDAGAQRDLPDDPEAFRNRILELWKQ